jgi:addiction module RelE/StbE family toxin
MGFKIVFTKPAIADLEGLARFISNDNPRAAEQFGHAIIGKAEGLGEFPFLGRVVPEFKIETIREIVHRPYRIVYRVFEDRKTIEIPRVWHAARGTPDIWPTAGL